MTAEVRIANRPVEASLLTRNRLNIERKFWIAPVAVGHPVQIPGHFIRNVVSLVAVPTIDQMIAGSEPVAIEDQHDVWGGRSDTLAQTSVSSDQIRILSIAHEAAKLFALH